METQTDASSALSPIVGGKDTWDVVLNKDIRDSSKGPKILPTGTSIWAAAGWAGQVNGQTDWCQEGAIPHLIVESTQARARLYVHNIQPALACLPIFTAYFFAKLILRLFFLQAGGQVQDINTLLRHNIIEFRFPSIRLVSHP